MVAMNRPMFHAVTLTAALLAVAGCSGKTTPRSTGGVDDAVATVPTTAESAWAAMTAAVAGALSCAEVVPSAAVR